MLSLAEVISSGVGILRREAGDGIIQEGFLTQADSRGTQ